MLKLVLLTGATEKEALMKSGGQQTVVTFPGNKTLVADSELGVAFFDENHSGKIDRGDIKVTWDVSPGVSPYVGSKHRLDNECPAGTKKIGGDVYFNCIGKVNASDIKFAKLSEFNDLITYALYARQELPQFVKPQNEGSCDYHGYFSGMHDDSEFNPKNGWGSFISSSVKFDPPIAVNTVLPRYKPKHDHNKLKEQVEKHRTKLLDVVDPQNCDAVSSAKFYIDLRNSKFKDENGMNIDSLTGISMGTYAFIGGNFMLLETLKLKNLGAMDIQYESPTHIDREYSHVDITR